MQFKDRQREKQRQSALKAKAAKSAVAETSAHKGKRKQQLPVVEAPKKLTAAKRRLLDMRQDADDMTNDYALFKKLKKGKLTEVLSGNLQISARFACSPST